MTSLSIPVKGLLLLYHAVMTSKTVLQRLRRINQRIADRVLRTKIGSLVGRLYFEPHTTGIRSEVPISEFRDLGITQGNNKVGTEEVGRRINVAINRDWWDSNRSVSGDYYVSWFDGDPQFPVDLEDISAPDEDVTASATFMEKLKPVTFYGDA